MMDFVFKMMTLSGKPMRICKSEVSGRYPTLH